jgi:polyvinyl alcohol dehydrogenase (cytochrome)
MRMTLTGLMSKKNGHRAMNTARVSGLVLALVCATLVAAPLMAQDWPMFGQNLANTASTSSNKISASNVGSLKPKWTFTTGGDVSARAAVVNSIAYFPDWGGNLWAVNTTNGQLVWGHQLLDYGLPAGTAARTTPALNDNSTLYIGTQQGAWLLAINAKTGALVWKTQLETADPYAIISASPTLSGSVVYTGVASTAEGASLSGADMAKAVARGSVVAVSTKTGAINWKTYTVPVGYLGGGVWGSSPVVDTTRNSVFVGTGDNYAHPQSTAPSSNPSLTYGACMSLPGAIEANCLSPDDHVDSILALNMTTGGVKWASRKVNWNQPYEPVNGYDDWNVDCIYDLPQCPSNPAAGPDYDFGSGPNEITYIGSKGKSSTIIGAGQKSGIYYALNPDTGAPLWQTQVGPGSALGGMEWGSASDGTRIYVAIANDYGIPTPLGTFAGLWAALDPANNGKVLWQTADPNGSIDIGPLAVANGVVYASSMGQATSAQNMVAMNAATGAILWSFAPGVSVNAGATVVNGVVYWGSGYNHLYLGSGNNDTFYAFSVNGN